MTRTKIINKNIEESDDGRVSPSIKHDDNGEAYIELNYPMGVIDEMRIKCENGLINKIDIKTISDTSEEAD